jgi:hypothetical protein
MGHAYLQEMILHLSCRRKQFLIELEFAKEPCSHTGLH